MDATLIKRAVELAQAQLLAENPGTSRPDVPWSWLVFGAVGRCERLLRGPQRNGIIYADPEPASRDETRRWFLRLGARVSHILEQCGFPRSALCADRSENVRPLSEWKKSFETRMQAVCDDAAIIASLDYFDVRSAMGDPSLLEALHAHWGNIIARQKDFLKTLARCALENLPPLTIFQNTIVDTDGKVETRLDVLRHMLMPLIDTARVCAWEYGLFATTPTIERFLQTSTRVKPQSALLFNEAAEAFRVALYHQAASGLQHGDDGRFLRPAELGKIDQEILKGVFRTVDELFRYLEKTFDLEGGGV